MKRVALFLLAAGLAGTALAETPAFSEKFEDQGRQMNVPVTFAADLGTVFVSADDVKIDTDVSCDGLSSYAMYVDSQLNRPPFEIRFLHDHPPYEDGDGNFLLDERETFKLKLGVEQVDRFGAQVGFTSSEGDQYLPLRFGPAREGDPNGDLFGELYIDGEPTGVRYGNVFDSVCSGANRMDGQVRVAFDMYGLDGVYFITIQSNAPYPQREEFGPFDIPETLMNSGYGACMIHGRSGSGRLLADGAICLASSTHELQPIETDRLTHRDELRRGRR